MGLDLADIRAAVIRQLGGNTSTEYDVNLDNIDLTAIINEALHAIESERDWPWLMVTETITTVSGTNLYTPSAGWYRTKSLAAPGDGPLKAVSPDALAQNWSTLTDTGSPMWFAEIAGQLDIRPTPASAVGLTHVYFRTEPDLVDDSDEPLLENRFRIRLIDMAIATAAARLTNWAKAQYYLAKDAKHEKRMVDDNRRTLGTKSVRVRRPGPWAGM